MEMCITRARPCKFQEIVGAMLESGHEGLTVMVPFQLLNCVCRQNWAPKLTAKAFKSPAVKNTGISL